MYRDEIGEKEMWNAWLSSDPWEMAQLCKEKKVTVLGHCKDIAPKQAMFSGDLLDIGVCADDSVRLLSQFVEEMDLSDLYSTYQRIPENPSPRTILKAVLYAYMNGDFSSRDMEEAYRGDSIQFEGSFGDLKEDTGFRRFRYRGKANVEAQSILLAIAHNVRKLHQKIQNGKTGTHLFALKKSA